MWAVINAAVVIAVLILLARVLYDRKLQSSDRYQATVVPLANIMDVGFLAMTPLIVVLLGVDAPLFMLFLVLLGLAVGLVMSYNMRYYEPLIGTADPLNHIAGISRWALVGASVANIGYYLKLMAVLVLAPLGIGADMAVNALAVALLAGLGCVGYFAGLSKLDKIGAKTTAFNLAAVGAVLAGFLAFNVQMLVTGQWDLPAYNPPNDPDRLRKLLGFFAIVQGFEASRYLRTRYRDPEFRISTMRQAQVIASVAFVVLIAASLILFAVVRPQMTPIAIIQIGKAATPLLPFLILITAITSQLSAGVNALSSRSDLLVESTHHKLPRKYTYPMLVAPCIALVLLADVTEAIAVASRIFAGYFLLQSAIAVALAWRRRKWLNVLVFVLIGAMMAGVAIFGLSS